MKKLIAIALALALALSLCACGAAKNGDETVTPKPVNPAEDLVTPSPDISDEPSPEPEIDSTLPINVMALSGTTGFGLAKLMADASEGTAALNYNATVETDASNITAALINGSVDIAALPTNAASALYNKTEGEIQLLALNTLGVLYVVCDSEKLQIETIEDLRGMTVYCPAQNPTFVFSYICEQNSLIPGEDVIIDNTYAAPADLRTALAAGEIDVAVLAEPLVTTAVAANEKLSVVLDLTAEWDAVSPEGSLVQGCVVVRREFAEQHPLEVAAFLEEYEKSIAYLSEDADAASEAIVAVGIFANAGVAKKAIPKCNICFIEGEDMRAAMSDFLDIMFSVAPQSIGGAIPAEDFYYIP